MDTAFNFEQHAAAPDLKAKVAGLEGYRPDRKMCEPPPGLFRRVTFVFWLRESSGVLTSPSMRSDLNG